MKMQNDLSVSHLNPDSSGKYETVDSLPSSSVTPHNSDCECGLDTEFEKVTEFTIPTSLPILWREWFCKSAEKNIYVNYLLQVQRTADLKIQKWSSKEENEDLPFVPVSDAFDEEFSPSLESVQVGFHRKTTRRISLNHGIPFVPKNIYGENTFTVIHKNGLNSLAVLNVAFVRMIGITTNVKTCFEQISENETKLSLYLNVQFGNGKISIPRGST